MLVAGPLANIVRLLVHVPLYAAAERRIELSQVADLNGTILACHSERSVATRNAVEESLTIFGRLRRRNRQRCFDFAQHDNKGGRVPYFPRAPRYFSASIAAAHPEPAAVIACL